MLQNHLSNNQETPHAVRPCLFSPALLMIALSLVLSACSGTAAGTVSESTTAETTAETNTETEPETTGEGSAAAEDESRAAAETEAAAEGEAAAGVATITPGKLMVGIEIGYPPMEYFDEDGATPIGFDVELATAIAEKLGLELELVDTAWDGIFAGVDTDKYDVIMSSVSWTEGRNENYLLSKTYVANAPVLVVPNNSEIADVMDLEGNSVGVQMETTADYLMQEYIKSGLNTKLVPYEKVINAFDDLKLGRTQAVCTDSVVAAYYLGDDAVNYKTVWEAEEKEPICMCFKKGNDALKDAMEAALDELKAEGKLGEIATKYFGSDITADME